VDFVLMGVIYVFGELVSFGVCLVGLGGLDVYWIDVVMFVVCNLLVIEM